MSPISQRVFNKLRFLLRRITAFNRQLPDFIIIGVQKGGTTSLFHYLKAHSKIRLSFFKETHYFDQNFQKPIGWYKSFFPFGKRGGILVGEATPSYLFFDEVPPRIKGVMPHCKFIVLLRDPIERAISHYKMNVNRGDDSSGSFELATGITPGLAPNARKQPNSRKFYSYLERGLYGKQLENWLKYFPVENFHFIKSEALFNNPREVLDTLFGFLNLDREYPSTFEKKNSGGAAEIGLQQSTIDYLDNYYSEDNRKLEKLIGPQFTYSRPSRSPAAT